MASLLILISFQLLSVFIESIYALCLLKLEVTNDIFALGFLLSPILALVLPKQNDRIILVIFAGLLVISRVAMNFFEVSGKLYVSGFGVGIFWLFVLPFFKWLAKGKQGKLYTVTSLAFAVLWLVLFRNLGSSIDVTHHKFWGLPFLCILFFMNDVIRVPTNLNSMTGDVAPAKGSALFSVLGLVAVILLLYFAFISPVVMSRWSEMSYGYIIIFFVTSLVGVVFVLVSGFESLPSLTKKWLVFWNIIFTIFLVLTIWIQRISFPTDFDAFPISVIPGPWYHKIPQVLTLLFWPVLLIDAAYFSKKISDSHLSIRLLSIYLSVAIIVIFTPLVFAHIFTSVWGYILPVSFYFKDFFWLVYLVPCLVVLASLFVLRATAWKQGGADPITIKSGMVSIFLFTLGLLTILVVYLISAKPIKTSFLQHSLKVMTFNVQQGTDINGNKVYREQLELIRQINPDVIGLQECDPARIANGNSDIVRYFADKLNYYSYYGASPVTGTFGVALLSRYPIHNVATHFLASDSEQVATVEAIVKVGDQSFNVFVNHPAGSYDTKITQTKQVLEIMKNKTNVVCIGDFNFTPDMEHYTLMVNELVDAWNTIGSEVVKQERCSNIDHIFVTPDIEVNNRNCVETDYSDHPVVWAELKVIK